MLYGDESLEVAVLLNDFGAHHLLSGKPEESAKFFHQALAVREKLLGTNHPHVAATLRNLGAVLLQQVKPVEAEVVFNRALAIERERLEPEHPDIAETMSGLGFAMAQQRRIVEAEKFFRDAIDLRRRAFGNSDSKAISISYSLGKALFQQEKWAEAELVARDILDAHQADLSPNADKVVTLKNLALVTARRGDMAEAKDLIARAFAEQKRLPENQQTNMFEPKQALVQLLVEINKFSEAERTFDDLMATQETAAGKPSEETILAYFRFASALEQLNRFGEAEKRYQTALELSEKTHGVEHESTAVMRFKLGGLLASRGAISEAIKSYQAALLFWDKSLTHDPRLFQSLMRLGELLCKQGRLIEAKQSFDRGLEMGRKQHGVPHAEVARSLYRVGNAFSDQGAYTEAEPFHFEAYEMRRRLFGDNNLAVADSLGCLGYLKRNEPKEAEKLFAQEVAIRDKLAPNDADTGNAHRNLSLVLNREKRADEAKAQMEMALAVGRKAWTNEPLKLAQTITGVARHLAHDKKYDQSEPLMLEAIRIIQANQQATVAEKRTQIEIIWKFYVDWAVAAPGSGKMQEALKWRKQLTEFEERLKAK
jgi:tetratricopeptide (TPR) repeat protein